MQPEEETLFRAQAAQDGVTHITTGVAVFWEGKLLVVQRAAHDTDLAGDWELPGGGVDEGESIQAGALREMKEETGLVDVTVLGTFTGFDYTTGRKPKARQANFVVTTQSSEISLDRHEHADYRWIAETDIEDLATNPVMTSCLHEALAAYQYSRQ